MESILKDVSGRFSHILGHFRVKFADNCPKWVKLFLLQLTPNYFLMISKYKMGWFWLFIMERGLKEVVVVQEFDPRLYEKCIGNGIIEQSSGFWNGISESRDAVGLWKARVQIIFRKWRKKWRWGGWEFDQSYYFEREQGMHKSNMWTMRGKMVWEVSEGCIGNEAFFRKLHIWLSIIIQRQHHWYTVAAGGHRSQSDCSHIAGDVADVHKPQTDCSHIAGDAADGR